MTTDVYVAKAAKDLTFGECLIGWYDAFPQNALHSMEFGSPLSRSLKGSTS